MIATINTNLRVIGRYPNPDITRFTKTSKSCAKINKVPPPNMNSSGADGETAGAVAALRINMLPPKFRLHRDVIFTLEDLFGSSQSRSMHASLLKHVFVLDYTRGAPQFHPCFRDKM